MATNPDFDWDEVIVTKRPKQKELECAFLSDPDLELGSRPEGNTETIIVESTGLTECQLQSCGAAEAYQNVLAYDEMAKCYGVRGEFFTVDTPAAIKFRIANTDNFPNQNVLDNYTSWNIRGNYPMLSAAPVSGAPCENWYDRQLLDATFLNGDSRGPVAFYPRAFEDVAGTELGPGDSLNVKTVMGNMIFDREEYGGYYSAPNPARTNFGYMRLLATGKNQTSGEFDGFNSNSINMSLAGNVLTNDPGQSNSEVDLVLDTINFNVSDIDGYPIQTQKTMKIDSEDFGLDGGEYMPLGTQTGAYMVKLEMDIQISGDGNTADARLYMELEHVKTGRRIQTEVNHQSAGINGGLKISSPWDVWGGFYTTSYAIDAQGGTATYNTRGGMEATTRYFQNNSNVSRSLWLIAYDGWENENKVRKACIEMERSRTNWSPREYCSRIQ